MSSFGNFLYLIRLLTPTLSSFGEGRETERSAISRFESSSSRVRIFILLHGNIHDDA
jgi:hypothetical protein